MTNLAKKLDSPDQEMQPTEPQLGRRVLSHYKPRTQSELTGWPAIAIGLLLVMAGFVMVGLAQSWFEPSTMPVDRGWLFTGLGLFFCLAGLGFVMPGLSSLRRQQKLARLKQTQGAMPWLWDYRWQQSGHSGLGLKAVAQHFFAALFVSLFIGPIYGYFLTRPDPHPFLYAMGALCALCMLGFFGFVGYRFIQAVKYRAVHLQYGQFPSRLGQTARFRLVNLPEHLLGQELEVTLRYIEDEIEVSGRGSNRHKRVVPYVVCELKQKVTFQTPGPLTLSFDLPRESRLQTKLSQHPARYWDLEARCAASGINFKDHYLIPVY